MNASVLMLVNKLDSDDCKKRSSLSLSPSLLTVQLNNHFLLYYDNQNSANSGGKLPAGAINLSMASSAAALL